MTVSVVCKKKLFATREDAELFEKGNREKYGLARQSPYACEDCTGWHLTALDRGSQALQSSFPQAVPINIQAKQQRRLSSSEVDKIVELFGKGFSIAELAKKFGVSPSAISYRVKGNNVASASGSYQPKSTSVDELIQEEQQLTAKLRAVQLKKEALITAKKLKLSLSPQGKVVIEKESNILGLTFPEAQELIDSLTVFVIENLPSINAAR